jgi:hypothetical protein
VPELIGKLFPGSLDIVGDVHGEVDALQMLVSVLGYDAQGKHPDGRRLVFIGDLIDRGPDSPAVIEWVKSLIDRGVAQCILGNHELNVLRNDAKSGNGWLIDPAHPEQQPGGEFAHSKVATDSMRARYLQFFDTLPLALVREELRVVHAAWHSWAVQQLSGESGLVTEVYQHYAGPVKQQLKSEGVTERAHAEKRQWQDALHDRHATVPLLPAVGEHGVRVQMSNPVRILTSGVERLAEHSAWANGQWRMTDRVRWWDEYTEEPAVVIGHYWRRLRAAAHGAHAPGRPPDVFAGVGPLEWIGPRKNVFCVDYSVGGRYEERPKGTAGLNTHLCALRWPERQLWGENGPVSPHAQAA